VQGFFLNQVTWLFMLCCVDESNFTRLQQMVGITKCVLPTEGQLIDTRESPPPSIMLARLLSGG
jgi:hypothetical protein